MLAAIDYRRTALIMVGFFAWATSALHGQNVTILDEIVAKVNNEVITLTDLQKELKLLRLQIGQEIKDAGAAEQEFEKRKKPLLRTLIDTKMMIQKAEELGITSNIDSEVAANLEETRKQAGIPNMEVFDQVLRQNGTSLSERREWIKREMIIDSLVQQFVYSKLTVLTPEIEAFYKENAAQFSEPAEVDLAEILFLTEGKDKAQVRKTSEEVLARLKAGASFEEEAKKHSDGPTAARGGGIGTFKKGSMAPAVEQVAFALNQGDISSIIETDYGLQIIKVVSKKENQMKPLSEVRPTIQRMLIYKKAEPEMKEFLDDLRSQSYIYIAEKYKTQYDLEGLI